MSPLTQTLELPIPALAASDVDAEPETDALAEAFGVDSTHETWYDPEPTTMSIPMAGGMETLVVDESVTAERSFESLTITPRRAKLALAALAVGAFAMGANEAAVVALSPQIATGLGIPVATIGLLATAFALTIVAATLPLTMLTQRLSRRLTLTSTLGLWTAGVVVAATASSVAHLATGRVLSAAAHALFWAIVAPTAARLFAPHLRGRSVTRILVGAAAAGVVGTPLVTVAGKSIGWQAPFWALAVFGVVLTVAMALTMPGKHHITADAAEQFAAPPTDEPSPTAPIARGDLPSKSAFARVLAVAFLASMAMSGTWTYIVPFYTGEARVTSGSVPLMFALGGVLAVGATLAVSPYLARRAVRTVAVGILALMLGWSLLALAQQWSAIAAQVVLSTGWAILLAALLNWAMRHTPWRTEIGAGAYTMTMNAGAAAGPMLGAAIVALWGIAWLPVVSFGLTFAAAVVTLGADKSMRRRLHVERRIRMARQERDALRARRREWKRRSEEKFERPKWKASSVKTASRDVAKRAGAGAARAGAGAARVVKRKPQSNRHADPTGTTGPGTSRPTRQHTDFDAE
ncbi:MFS transporter [Demequina oxidasica]|uniref:MFS transporter n=1 Tax=Demequina oxidasica TaxID=676199 RepID=UPI000782E612|nr:MFS transporter [Demequina oxidasica]